MTDETISNSDANNVLSAEEVEYLLDMMSDVNAETSVRKEDFEKSQTLETPSDDFFFDEERKQSRRKPPKVPQEVLDHIPDWEGLAKLGAEFRDVTEENEKLLLQDEFEALLNMTKKAPS
jgi:hypothetical protein